MSAAAYAIAIAMNDTDKTVALKKKQLAAARESLLKKEERERSETEVQLIETFKLPYLQNGFCRII